jgi:anti-anti-sigma factor
MEEGYVRVNIKTSPSIPNLKIITIEGNFDKVTAEQVDKKVLPIIKKGRSNIILDLSNLGYLSCIGMLCLIKYSTFLTDKKRLLKLVKPTKNVYNSLKAAGITRHFNMYDTLEAAISSF